MRREKYSRGVITKSTIPSPQTPHTRHGYLIRTRTMSYHTLSSQNPVVFLEWCSLSTGVTGFARGHQKGGAVVQWVPYHVDVELMLMSMSMSMSMPMSMSLREGSSPPPDEEEKMGGSVGMAWWGELIANDDWGQGKWRRIDWRQVRFLSSTLQ